MSTHNVNTIRAQLKITIQNHRRLKKKKTDPDDIISEHKINYNDSTISQFSTINELDKSDINNKKRSIL